MYKLRSGSIEYILVHVGDRLEDVSALTGLTPTFSVYANDDTPKQVDAVAAIDVMTAKCLVDTTLGGNWPSDKYHLYLKLSASPEAPILGPVTFLVEEL